MRGRIINKLSDCGFSGPLEFRMFVGYKDSFKPKMNNIQIFHANECDSKFFTFFGELFVSFI